MNYDKKTNRYRDKKGRFVSPEQIRKQIEKVVDVVGRKNRSLTERLNKKQIDLSTWKKEMRQNLKNLHTLSGAVGRGGRKQMSKSDWGKVGAEVRKQYKFLDNFERDIKAGRVSPQMAEYRATLYGRSARSVHSKMEMVANEGRMCRRILHASESCAECRSWAGKGFVAVEDQPPIGGLICRSNCRCGIEYK